MGNRQIDAVLGASSGSAGSSSTAKPSMSANSSTAQSVKQRRALPWAVGLLSRSSHRSPRDAEGLGWCVVHNIPQQPCATASGSIWSDSITLPLALDHCTCILCIYIYIRILYIYICVCLYKMYSIVLHVVLHVQVHARLDQWFGVRQK